MVHNNFVSSVCALQPLPFNQSFETYFLEEKTELKSLSSLTLYSQEPDVPTAGSQ